MPCSDQRVLSMEKLPNGNVEKYSFRSEEPIYLAGLYIRSSKAVLPCFSILTMNAPEPIKSIRSRMPVIVTESQKEDWLQGKLAIKDAFQWSAGKESVLYTMFNV